MMLRAISIGLCCQCRALVTRCPLLISPTLLHYVHPANNSFLMVNCLRTAPDPEFPDKRELVLKVG